MSLSVPLLQKRLLAWYAANKRDLPWRRTDDPYARLVAEFMLQQTGTGRVAPKYREFLERFPTFQALAAASSAEVLRAWSGLGYNRRALNLHRVAWAIVERHGGHLPESVKELRNLPGIGPYTAAAVACFALGQQVATVDTNVRRVLTRLFWGLQSPHASTEKVFEGAWGSPDCIGAPPRKDRLVEQVAQEVLPRGRAQEWDQALMDLGAAVCLARRPRCHLCPVSDLCAAYLSIAEDGYQPVRQVAERQSPYLGSRRYYRGKIVERLRGLVDGEVMGLVALGHAIKEDFCHDDLPWLEGLLRELEGEGMVTMVSGAVRLPD